MFGGGSSAGSSSNGRSALRHSSSGGLNDACNGMLDRILAACGACTLRGFIVGVGGALLLANLALLLLLNGPGSSLVPDHRPSGGPVPGTDVHHSSLLAPVPRAGGGGDDGGSDGPPASRSASLLKSHFQRTQTKASTDDNKEGAEQTGAYSAEKLAEFERLATERLAALQQQAEAKLQEQNAAAAAAAVPAAPATPAVVPAAAPAAATPATTPSESGPAVVSATDLTFDREVLQATEQIVMVDFFAPWCSHCRNLAPEWQKAGETLRARSAPIKLVTLDATRYRALAATHAITSYPTIKVFHRGSTRPELYTGPRLAAPIVEYALAALDPTLEPARKETDALDRAAEQAAAQLADIQQRRAQQQ